MLLPKPPSPFNENVGFMSYNALAGGMLTGKYLNQPAALDDANRDRAMELLRNPRGRMDTRGWGGTLSVSHRRCTIGNL
jgi:hypothetical protein